jgi:hypothetical protein
MSGFAMMRRLQAYGLGKPLPFGSTKRLRVVTAPQTMLLAFLRMGGETAPWGIGWKLPGKAAKFATVPEPRDRDMVANMVAGEFAEDLLTHLLHSSAGGQDRESKDLPPLRQIWVPGQTHVEMLHLLAMAYAFAKNGPAARVRTLQWVGRAANFLFLASQRQSQQMLVDATRLLREAYAFPADDLRQSHLGFLLAWLTTQGDASARIDAAARAEAMPVSTALDPALDKNTLAPLVEAYGKAAPWSRGEGRRAAENPAAKSARADIARVLEEELSRRLSLVEAARKAYMTDPRAENAGLDRLVDATRSLHNNDYLKQCQREANGETAYFPSPVTDRNPRQAAIRFLDAEADSALYFEALSAYDEEMVDEILAGGDGLVGKIVNVVDATEGERKMTPMWTIACDGLPPLRLKEGDKVSLRSFPKRRAQIVRIEATDSGRVFELEIVDGKRKPDDAPSELAAVDKKLVGRRVCLLNLPTSFFDKKRASELRFAEGPGDWLTKNMGIQDVYEATEDES